MMKIGTTLAAMCVAEQTIVRKPRIVGTVHRYHFKMEPNATKTNGCEDSDIFTVNGNNNDNTGPLLMGTMTLIDVEVLDITGTIVGKVVDFVFEVGKSVIRYAIVSFNDWVCAENRLFAIPWRALKLDLVHNRVTLTVNTDRLMNAPGFDKDNWPDMTDEGWIRNVHAYYSASRLA